MLLNTSRVQEDLAIRSMVYSTASSGHPAHATSRAICFFVRGTDSYGRPASGTLFLLVACLGCLAMVLHATGSPWRSFNAVSWSKLTMSATRISLSIFVVLVI